MNDRGAVTNSLFPSPDAGPQQSLGREQTHLSVIGNGAFPSVGFGEVGNPLLSKD